MLIDDDPAKLAQEYHVASRNASGLKHAARAHLVHYSRSVQELVSKAPLSLSGRQRTRLPPAPRGLPLTLDQAIEKRISSRGFTGLPISLIELPALLYFGNGVREVFSENGGIRSYQRNVPNSGNLGPIEVYPIAINVDGIEGGMYHFDTVSHELVLIHKGQFSRWLRDRVFFQLEFSRASVVLVLAGCIGRLAEKYGPRCYRLALLDTGHVSQNINLTATSLDLQVCATAGFIDDELDIALGLDGIEVASLLAVAVGPSGAGR